MLLNYELSAVTLENDDKHVTQVTNQVLISNSAEYYVFVPQSVMKRQKHTNTQFVLESSEFASIEELDAKLQENIIKDDKGQWKCSICQRAQQSQSRARAHCETHLKTIRFPCQECNVKPRTRHTLRAHMRTNHQTSLGTFMSTF